MHPYFLLTRDIDIRILSVCLCIRDVPALGSLRRTVVERQSVTGELSLSCARPAADG